MKKFSDKIKEKVSPFANNNKIRSDIFSIVEESIKTNNDEAFLRGKKEVVLALEELINKEVLIDELKVLESFIENKKIIE